MNLKRIRVRATGNQVDIDKYLVIKEARVSKDYNNFRGEDIWTKKIYSALKRLYGIAHTTDYEQIFQIKLGGRAGWDTIEKNVLKNFPKKMQVVIDNE